MLIEFQIVFVDLNLGQVFNFEEEVLNLCLGFGLMAILDVHFGDEADSFVDSCKFAPQLFDLLRCLIA